MYIFDVNDAATTENNVHVFQNIKIESLCYSTTQFLDIYLKELKLGSWGNTSNPVFIIGLFMIVKMWKQPKCPLINQ